MLTVGIFLPLIGENWLGGLNYFKNLLRATNCYSDGRFNIVMLTDRPELLENCSGPFSTIERCDSLLFKKSVLSFISHLYFKLGGTHFLLTGAAKAHAIEMISHNHIGYQRSIPTLSWIPDFQHRALPHLFSKLELALRERAIRSALKLGNVLVSSQSACDDFRRYYPKSRARVFVLPFASMGSGSPQAESSLDDLRQRYSLPERFAFLPNQFWEHKNHKLAIESLRQSQENVTIVCTGSTSDHRNSGHLANLTRLIDTHNLGERFRILGVIPYPDVLALMRHAIVVLNPSRFEGWSTTVEEAKILGKRLLLSSIPVHKEQAGDTALYFNADDPIALGRLLDTVFNSSNDRTSDPVALAAQATERQREFVDRYFEIINSICKPTQ